MSRPLLALVAFLAAHPGVGAAEPAKKPNVLIVMTDDQGLGDFSYTGNPVLKTPNFDAFARRSVRLTDFHVAPMCSPTRGQLLTGLGVTTKIENLGASDLFGDHNFSIDAMHRHLLVLRAMPEMPVGPTRSDITLAFDHRPSRRAG